MRILVVFVAAILSVSCVSRPDLNRAPTDLQLENCDQGMRLMGEGWFRAPTPHEAQKMLASVRFEVQPQGVIWYSRDGKSIGACAYTGDRNGCGYSGHEFKNEAGLWFHALTWYQDPICVAG
jgi:hypothetical protein